MSHTEIVEYPDAKSAREALVRLYPDPAIGLIELVDGNRTLVVTYFQEPTDDSIDVTSLVQEIASTDDRTTEQVTADVVAAIDPILENGTAENNPVTGEPVALGEATPEGFVEIGGAAVPSFEINEIPITKRDDAIEFPEERVNISVTEADDDDDLGLNDEPVPVIGEIAALTVDLEELDRGGLRQFVEDTGIDVTVYDKTPLAKERDKIRTALEASKEN